jgi:hypothetical protein
MICYSLDNPARFFFNLVGMNTDDKIPTRLKKNLAGTFK